MVEVIGFMTIGGLVWLLAWSLAGESDAERRRVSSTAGVARSIEPSEKALPIKRAA